MNGTGHYPRGGAGSKSYASPRWRFAELLEALGPYRLMVDRLEAKGYPRIPLSSIAGWRMRNTIPSPWLPAILGLAVESRIIKTVDDLRVEVEKGPEHERRRGNPKAA